MAGSTFTEFVMEARRNTVSAWSGQHKIPWNNPEFSRRMLDEHLSQKHDLASRRQTEIDRHVEFIHSEILHKKSAWILDLGCGPGFYMQRLNRLGHSCSGIDFSPASVAYARSLPECAPDSIVEADILNCDFGADFDLVMLLFGEFNTFTPVEGRRILHKAAAALKAGGCLLLELSRFDSLRRHAAQNPSWSAVERGLFADHPYICLQENRWFAGENACRSDFFVLHSDGVAQHYASSAQAYSDEEYTDLLTGCGLSGVRFYGDYGRDDPASDFMLAAGFKG